MNPISTPVSLLSALRGLRISGPACRSPPRALVQPQHMARRAQNVRAFSTTGPVLGNWLEPKLDRNHKVPKGRPRVPTGGSMRGTTVVWGDWGLRMVGHDRRIGAKVLKTAEDAIRNQLRGQRYRLYTRKVCNTGVFTKGSDMRMGKGKGSFDHWATRMAVCQILFEIKGPLHERLVRDAFRLAGAKLPGQWEVAKKGDPPYVGVTRLEGVTLEELKRPRRPVSPAKMIEEASSTPTSPTPTSPAPASPTPAPPTLASITSARSTSEASCSL